jgi:hypothetical protein
MELQDDECPYLHLFFWPLVLKERLSPVKSIAPDSSGFSSLALASESKGMQHRANFNC